MQTRTGKTRVTPSNANAYWQRALLISLIFLTLVAPAAMAQPNTGMADSTALISAFDKSLNSGDVLTLSVSNLRGLSNEALNAGGRVIVNLATGVVTSNVTGLPSNGSFD